MRRREFLGATAAGLVGAATAWSAGKQNTRVARKDKRSMQTMAGFLDTQVLARETIDTFLDPDAPNWAIFDPELGYTLKSSIVRDGMDDSFTVGRYAPTGERQTIQYADHPCRINAYGNSFTQCHQVSDGETWEEYLAGHLGEPIRNFGVGGYGVYQAYRRMLRTEATGLSASHIILNVWGVDDHYRSVDAWRGPRCGDWFETNPAHMFHANPWDHVRLDLDSGGLIEKDSLCPTPESLYNLCDAEWVHETFGNDLALQMFLAENPAFDIDLSQIQQVADALGRPLDMATAETRVSSVRSLYWEYAQRATMQIVRRAKAFAETEGKRLIVLLSYGDFFIAEPLEGKPRRDRAFVDFLEENGIPYIDAIAKHIADYQDFKVGPWDYLRRYYIGHYNPSGNHFFAFAIKDEIVDWLDPKPLAYRDHDAPIRFDKDYLKRS